MFGTDGIQNFQAHIHSGILTSSFQSQFHHLLNAGVLIECFYVCGDPPGKTDKKMRAVAVSGPVHRLTSLRKSLGSSLPASDSSMLLPAWPR